MTCPYCHAKILPEGVAPVNSVVRCPHCYAVFSLIDLTRRPRYQAMTCLVSPQAALSPGALRILQRTFGTVKEGEW